MAPPPSQVITPIVPLIVRIITCVLLLISLILLVSPTGTTDSGKVNFSDVKAFRYLCAAIVIGLAYSLMQTALTVVYVTTGNRIGGEAFLYVDFFGDKIISYFLATGPAACFGITHDMKEILGEPGLADFTKKVNAASALCLLGFLLTAILSVISSLSLPKKV